MIPIILEVTAEHKGDDDSVKRVLLCEMTSPQVAMDSDTPDTGG